jgi:hypothetical protein
MKQKDYLVSIFVYKNPSGTEGEILRLMTGNLAVDYLEQKIDDKQVGQFEVLDKSEIDALVNKKITQTENNLILAYQKDIFGKDRSIASIKYRESRKCFVISNSYVSEGVFDEWKDGIFSDLILKDPTLRRINIDFYIDDVRSTKSQKVLRKIKTQRKIPSGTQGELGFHIYWAFVIPPKGDSLLLGDYFENHDIFLEAPVYKAEKLPGGGTFIQLTEEYDVYGENQDYIDTWLKAYEFFQKHKIT